MKDNYTPKSEWEQQYEREYKRITQAIRRQTKLGYYVPKEVKPTPPSKVKTFSQSAVEDLIKITPKEIRKNSIWIDKENGEAFEGLDIVKSSHIAKPSKAKVSTHKKKRKKQINEPTVRKRKRKNKNTEKVSAPPKENNLNMQIIDTINRLLDEWQPAPYWHNTFLERKTVNYHRISTLWKEILSNEGEYEVAYRLESNATEFIRLVERLLYSSDSTVEDDFNMGRFIELLINRPLSAYESDMYTEMAREAAMDSLRGENSIG